MSGKLNIGLLRAARNEFVERLLPQLGPDDRYTGAMLKRSLDVLLAAASSADPEDGLRAAGLGDAGALAQVLRRRAIADDPQLRAALRDFVCRKLEITNPRFLSEARAAEKNDRRQP